MMAKYNPQPASVKRGTADVAAEGRTSHSNVDAVKARQSDSSGAVKHGERERTMEKSKATATGASRASRLANPNKKARKYAAIEFESDED